MKSKIPEIMILSELEDALEERQKPDRRAINFGSDPETTKDRRRADRRAKSFKDKQKQKH